MKRLKSALATALLILAALATTGLGAILAAAALVIGLIVACAVQLIPQPIGDITEARTQPETASQTVPVV